MRFLRDVAVSVVATAIFNLLLILGGAIGGVNWPMLIADLTDRFDTANVVALAVLFLGGVGSGFFLLYGGLENLYYINKRPTEATPQPELDWVSASLWPQRERLSPQAQRERDIRNDVYPLLRGGSALLLGTLVAAAAVLYFHL